MLLSIVAWINSEPTDSRNATPPTPSPQLSAVASPPIVPEQALPPEQVFQRVSASVVVIDVLDSRQSQIALGSGVVIGRGQVVTNCHVTAKGISIRIRQGQQSEVAVLQYVDSQRDLCQLHVPGLRAPPVMIRSIKDVKVGQRVYAVGAPKGLELSLSEGLGSVDNRPTQ